MKILKYFVFVMVTQALVFAVSGLGEDGCDKQSGGSSYTGPRRAPLPTDQPGGGDRKHYKKGDNRPAFMTPFPTMDGVSLGIESALIQISTGTTCK
jgi:hypothetical protein